MDRPLVAVVLAGGTGTRLYPAARSDRPKQFLTFGGDRSLLTRTVDRAAFTDETVVSTRPGFADDVPAHAPGASVLVEPVGRDTGPALVYAAHVLHERDDEPVLLCLPSDHHVGDGFEPVARRAAELAAETDDLVMLGVTPDRPATGYGYVVPGEPLGDRGYAVESFVEKPAADRAASLVDDGALWNAGMFAWTAEALLREARASSLAPLVEGLEAGELDAAFDVVEPASIDRAVLEHTDRAAVVPADFAWDDLGTWDAVGRTADGPLCDALELDATGNVIAGDDTHVTVVGASDLVVAAYDDRVLVVPTERAQDVREAVKELERSEFY